MNFTLFFTEGAVKVFAYCLGLSGMITFLSGVELGPCSTEGI